MTSINTVNEKMKGVVAKIAKAASSDMPVAIFGAKGVGKSHCARIIHEKSVRVNKPFVTVDSGANVRKNFETAGDGTIFFSNFNTYPEEQLSEILEHININQPCRLITSSSENLDKISKRYNLSEPLCHKLSVIQIKVPSLRERKDDLPLLIRELAAEISSVLHKEHVIFTPKAIEKLSARNWPGNVEELKKIIFFTLCNAKTSEINACDITAATSQNGESINEGLYRISMDLISIADNRGVYNAAEKYEEYIWPPLLKAAMDTAKGNRSKAAELLGINRNTLRIKLKKFLS
jgi:DNA-binding NtrC family response regulator